MLLNKPVNLFEKISNREWYLVDGQEAVYMLSQASSFINYAFVPISVGGDFLQKSVWGSVLYGADILFRTENGMDCSLITSDGIEFLLQGNHWCFRNYSMIKNRVCSFVSLENKVFSALLSYVLFCSKNGISSIIWVPTQTKSGSIKRLLKNRNFFGRKRISIIDPVYNGLIIRFLSSDGATIISPKGNVLGFGCIVDNTKIIASGIKGTGEMAARLLAQNGIAFKISQDGAVKLFVNENEEPFII